MSRAVLCTGTVAVGLLLSGLARADCTKDTDCKGDRVCEKGVCTAQQPAPTPSTPTRCSSDTDCAGTMICEEAECRAPESAAPAAAGSATPPPRSPLAAPVPAMANVHFSEPSGVQIQLGGKSCTSPCTIEIEPGLYDDLRIDQRHGPYSLRVAGDSEVRAKRKSPGVLIAGLILAGVGVSMSIGSGVWFSGVKDARDQCVGLNGTTVDRCEDAYSTVLPLATLITGVSLVFVGGVIMVPVGVGRGYQDPSLQRVGERNVTLRRPPTEAVRAWGLAPIVTKRANGVGLTFAF